MISHGPASHDRLLQAKSQVSIFSTVTHRVKIAANNHRVWTGRKLRHGVLTIRSFVRGVSSTFKWEALLATARAGRDVPPLRARPRGPDFSIVWRSPSGCRRLPILVVLFFEPQR